MRCMMTLLACGWLLISQEGKILSAHDTSSECYASQGIQVKAIKKTIDGLPAAEKKKHPKNVHQQMYNDFAWARCLPSDTSPQLLK